MIRFECDKCRRHLAANDAQRYIVKIEAYAAAGPIEFAADDLDREHKSQIEALIDDLNRADPSDIEDQTYRSFRFDLCAACHRAFLTNPLG